MYIYNTGSTHQLLTLDDLVTEISKLEEIKEREKKLSDLFKQIEQGLSDFDDETEQLLMTMHRQRDLQVNNISIGIILFFLLVGANFSKSCTVSV